MMSSTSDPRDPKPPAAAAASTVTGYPTTTAAYPYPAQYSYNPNPNPNYNHNPNYNSNPNYNPANYQQYPYQTQNPNPNRLFRRLLIFAIGIFIIVAAATFISWLVLRPKLPEFSISSFHVSGFTLAKHNKSLSGTFQLKLNVRNVNKKMSVSYDEIRAAVMYRDNPLAESQLTPFNQKTGEFDNFNVSFVASEEYVDDEVVLGEDGRVGFGVKVLSIVNFKAGAWRTRRHLLRVQCDSLEVGFKSLKGGSGDMVGGDKSCLVGI